MHFLAIPSDNQGCEYYVAAFGLGFQIIQWLCSVGLCIYFGLFSSVSVVTLLATTERVMQNDRKKFINRQVCLAIFITLTDTASFTTHSFTTKQLKQGRNVFQ